MRNPLIAVALLSFATHACARSKTDVLIMQNDDHLTCEVKGLNNGVLYVSFDYIDGTTPVDWAKVKKLESSQLFVVKTEDGSVYTGTLRTSQAAGEQPVRIEVLTAPEQASTLNRSQIVEMIATSDKFWQRFNGSVGAGVIYNKGNQSTQYSLSSSADYVRERWGATAGFESTLSSSTGASAATRNYATITALHLFPWQNWYYFGLGEFLQSSEQDISLQSTAGGGVGRYLRNTNRSSIRLSAGAVWQGTSYSQPGLPVGEQNLAAGLLAADVQFFRFSKTSLRASASLLPALSDPGRLRFNTDATYYVKIFSDLKWNISFYGNWDNRPPSGSSGSDYGTSSGLSWTFGLR
jgi:hypothetical protein